MPKLAAFPKAYMDDLCQTGKMSLRQWFELATTLDIDGVELYAGIQDLADPENWRPARQMAKDYNLELPMMCCSPDFSHPSAEFRQRQVDQEKVWIDMTAELGGAVLPSTLRTAASRRLARGGTRLRVRVHRSVPQTRSRPRHRARVRKPLQGQLLEVPRICPADGCVH